MEQNSREFDIMIFGEKRLSIGVLVTETYNIEIETRKCSNKVINSKYNDSFLFSVIIANGESNAAHDSAWVYSLIDYKENYCSVNFDFKNQTLPSIKDKNVAEIFSPAKKEYAFVPKVVNNNCSLLKNKLGENNIMPLEAILNSKIEPNLKKGVLYFLCDNLIKDYKVRFMPELMQVSFMDINGLNTCLIDCLLNRQRVRNYEVSKSYEKFLTKRYNKKIAKSLSSKNFSLITSDSEFADSIKGSEIGKVYLLKDSILQNGLNDYLLRK
ncbi:MAG: hypothetical protein WC376_04560 [Candidatus Nanoarchaeia archaeon]|jgi:hypothetical protein